MKAVKAILCIAITAVLLVSGFKIENKLNEYRTALDKKTERVYSVRKGRTVDFKQLKAENEDVKGWIWLPDSNIDYPIVQSEDNDYYLHRDLDGSYLYDGCIFIDAYVDDPFRDFNTVIYGHHMFSGAMFCDLEKYEDEDWFLKHDTIIIETEYGSYDLKVIAFCNEPADSKLYTTWFAENSEESLILDDSDMPTQEEIEQDLTKEDFVQLIRDKAVILSDTSFDENDTFVTLSTCAYNYDEARHQVIGKITDPEKESREIVTETKKPFLNKWLLLQIVVGIVMVIAVIGLIAELIDKK